MDASRTGSAEAEGLAGKAQERSVTEDQSRTGLAVVELGD
jgi:hypothetical protein